MTCPLCHGAPGTQHAPGCPMECPLCRAPCGEGHRMECVPFGMRRIVRLTRAELLEMFPEPPKEKA